MNETVSPVALTAARSLLTSLAEEQRSIVSDWRAAMLLFRATANVAPDRRRWEQAPASFLAVHPLLRQMARAGDLTPLPGLRHIYRVTAPYASSAALCTDELLFELDPYAVIAFGSAFAFHGLAHEFSSRLTALTSRTPLPDMLPMGMSSEDWWNLPVIRPQHPAQILDVRLEWIPVQARQFFGFLEYRQQRYPVRVTTLERTLIDGLHQPDHCGGIDAVLHAWFAAKSRLHLQAVLEYTERMGIALVRQRVGYVLEALGFQHQQLNTWAQSAQRGGSSKLVTARPYASVYSERWSLSLNAPVDQLTGTDD